MYKAHQRRTTFGSWDVEKVHAVVARSTFRSLNVQNTPRSEHFWKLRCSKSVRRCGAKHICKSKCTKHTHTHHVQRTLEVEMFKKCRQLWREAHFQVKSAKFWRVRSTFGRSDVVSRGRRKELCTLSKVSNTWKLSSISQNDARRGTFEEDLERCIFRGRRSTRDMVVRSGCWFPEKGCILEHQIFSFGKMILCYRCSTSYDLASLFGGRRLTSETWTGKIAKRIGTRPSAPHSTFHYWRKSRGIASFLMLPTSTIEEVSQNCFLFDVIKLKGSKVEEVSQNCFLFDVIKFKRKVEEVSQVFKIADCR